jgi:hypothetical protein
MHHLDSGKFRYVVLEFWRAIRSAVGRFPYQGDEIMVNQSVLQGNWKQIKGKLR